MLRLLHVAGSPGRRRLPAALLAGVLGLGLAACTGAHDQDAPVRVQPGAPGQPGRVLGEGESLPSGQSHTPADVTFMHGMIAHHEQALRMTDLVPERTDREEIALFARRIEIAQAGEISQMQDWLAVRGETAGPGHHHPDAHLPGMLTEAQFDELAAATGSQFDRRFLELMIHHHEGALIMVTELRERGGGQEAEVSQLATHFDADQRIEIDRMKDLLAAIDEA